jgi:glycosyltransferase involved in cell wall biosynthesis
MQAAFSKIEPSAFDIIRVERRDLFQIVRHHTDKVILDLDDIDHLKHLKKIKTVFGLYPKSFGLTRLAYLFVMEVLICRTVPIVVVCSQSDSRYLETIDARRAYSIPNGSSVEAVDTPVGPGSRFKEVVFLANMQFPPNIDALLYFDQQILPLIVRKMPNLVLHVVGNPPEDPSVYSERIVFGGFVQDLKDHLSAYTAMIAPIRYGGGTKTKIIDGMVCGLPVITTSVGAEGLDIVHRQHALISDTPEAFAQGVVRVLDDPVLARDLASEALRYAKETLSWRTIGADLVGLIRSFPGVEASAATRTEGSRAR